MKPNLTSRAQVCPSLEASDSNKAPSKDGFAMAHEGTGDVERALLNKKDTYDNGSSRKRQEITQHNVLQNEQDDYDPNIQLPSYSQDKPMLNRQQTNAFSLGNKRLLYVTKFITKVKVYSSYLKFTRSSRQLLSMINDIAFDYDYFYFKNIFLNEVPSLFEKVVNYLQCKQEYLQNFSYNLTYLQFDIENVVERIVDLDKKSGAVMLPNSFVSRVWDFIQLVLLLIYIVYLPIRLAFETVHETTSAFLILEILPNVSQIINMFLEFNTGFFSHGVVIVDRVKIFRNYCAKKFIYDIVLNICWLISLDSSASMWFKTMGLFRIIVLMKLLSEIEQTFNLRELFGSYFVLMKLGGFIFLCAHLCGCCWYAIAIYEGKQGIQETWLIKDIMNYENQDLDIHIKAQSYVASIYWCIVTMTTIGYGDILPVTFAERIFAVFICVLSSFIFAFSMSSISDIIRSISSENENYKTQMALLNLYMKKRKLNLELRIRVRKYYENLYLDEKDDNEKGANMIHQLTPEIRVEVLKEIFTNIFQSSKFMSSQFSAELISKLYNTAEEKHIPADEYLFKEGDTAEKLFLILKGEVQLTLQGSLNMQCIKENNLVGLTEFITNREYKYSARCNRFCQFVEIKYEDFLKIAKETQHDFEKFCELKDSILLNGENLEYSLHCEGCGKTDHIFQKCQYINISKNQKVRFIEINKRKQITRQPWERRKESYQSMRGQQQVVQAVQEYLSDMEQENKLYQGTAINGSPSNRNTMIISQDFTQENEEMSPDSTILANQRQQRRLTRQRDKSRVLSTQKENIPQITEEINDNKVISSNNTYEFPPLKEKLQRRTLLPHLSLPVNSKALPLVQENNNNIILIDPIIEQEKELQFHEIERGHSIRSNEDQTDDQNMLLISLNNQIDANGMNFGEVGSLNFSQQLEQQQQRVGEGNNPLDKKRYSNDDGDGRNQLNNGFSQPKISLQIPNIAKLSQESEINNLPQINNTTINKQTGGTWRQSEIYNDNEGNTNKAAGLGLNPLKIPPLNSGSLKQKEQLFGQFTESLPDSDRFMRFKNYLLHNNIDKVLMQYNTIVEKNQLYIALLKKAMVKAEQQRKKNYENAKHRTIRVVQRKRIPSSQQFYSNKVTKIPGYISIPANPVSVGGQGGNGSQ